MLLYGEAVLGTVLVSVVLCLVNVVVLGCFCYRRETRGGKFVYRARGAQCEDGRHMEHSRETDMCYDSTECLNNSVTLSSTPVRDRVPTFSTVGRVVVEPGGAGGGGRRDRETSLPFLSPLAGEGGGRPGRGDSYIPLPLPDYPALREVATHVPPLPPPGPFNSQGGQGQTVRFSTEPQNIIE